MKKVIALILVLSLFALSLAGCSFKMYTNGAIYKNLNSNVDHSIYAKVEAHSFMFDINDVEFDFYYSLYSLDNNLSLEQVRKYHFGTITLPEIQEDELDWEYVYGIFLSNNEDIVFEDDNVGVSTNNEYGVNAKLIKFIDFEESFNTNYGYSSSGLKLIYNHKEKLSVPAELLAPSSNCLYVHIVRFVYMPENDAFVNSYYKYTLSIKYTLNGDKVIVQ